MSLSASLNWFLHRTVMVILSLNEVDYSLFTHTASYILEVFGSNLGRVTECDNKTAGLRFENISCVEKP